MTGKNPITFITRFRSGYTPMDRIKIFLYSVLYILFYPINVLSFALIKRNLIHLKKIFNGFGVVNSDGVYVCRDNVDLDIVSENFERDIRKYFKNFNRGTFVDIGANIGKYTVMISNQMKDNGRIISIEPHPDNFKILEKNIEINELKNITPLNLACWNKKDSLKLFNHENQPLLASVTKSSGDFMEVAANSVDNILEEFGVDDVDMIKLDVEGAEAKVLEGMDKLLRKGRVKIIFEAWDDEHLSDCRKLLGGYNYKVEHLNKMYWMGLPK
ncbi:MAG: FkbM family methyltransferase [Candidatus Aenigmarchaeota archaeon]|nr:FkbM family methyltransferase [Candidatus Aenigmarchaeota archaeon]